MRPHKIFFFLLLLGLLLFGVSQIFPENGIVISDNFSLKFHYTLNDVKNTPPQYADITTIIAENEVLPLDSIINDTLIENKIDTIRASATVLKQKIQNIEYPAGDSSALYFFFKKLDKSKKRRMRILHYGDSQIEGDRITGYLRNRFQKRFGGNGPGLLPTIPGNAESSSIIHNVSSNWRKHSIYFKRDTILPHRKFGILGSFARFTSYKADTLNIDSTIHSAFIEFSKSGMAYLSARKFNECRVFYGHCNEPIIVKGFANDSLIWFNELDSTQKTNILKWEFTTPPDKFRIEFDGNKSPDIYGLALDSHIGVAVDNLPLRGSSGTEFTKINFTQMSQMSSSLNSGLVILEFGVNVVPYITKNYNFYERSMTRQIKYLKQCFPKASFLVIGVSDMSQKKGNYYASYPNINKIRQAQRNAAINANCAYWDLHTAMGGENSMPSWVFAKPSLAQKDFTHFNRKGGHIVAQMLFNALMNEYEAYQLLNKPKILVKTY